MKGSGSYNAPGHYHGSSSFHESQGNDHQRGHTNHGSDAQRGRSSFQANQNHGGDPQRGRSSFQAPQNHWGDHVQSSPSRSHNMMPSSPHHNLNLNSDSDNKSEHYLDLMDDFYEDDDEIYLRPGEPWGTLLMPVEDPYIRSDRIEEANRELFSGPMSDRKTKIKVRIWEDRNEYYELEDNSDRDYEVNDESYSAGKPRVDRNTPVPNPSYGEPVHTRQQSPHNSSPR